MFTIIYKRALNYALHPDNCGLRPWLQNSGTRYAIFHASVFFWHAWCVPIFQPRPGSVDYQTHPVADIAVAASTCSCKHNACSLQRAMWHGFAALNVSVLCVGSFSRPALPRVLGDLSFPFSWLSLLTAGCHSDGALRMSPSRLLRSPTYGMEC